MEKGGTYFSRRNILFAFFFSALSGLVSYILKFLSPKDEIKFSFVRPPGTADENRFLDRCIRCRACANVCEAGCIKFFSFHDSIKLAGTPYLNTRIRACNLCMNCTNICPTAALEAIPREINAIKENVNMGLAIVLESNCLSFNGRVCGVCHDACPVNAIKLEPIAKPIVIEDACIGCGRCEERCPQQPTAIKVIRKPGFGLPLS